MRRGSAVTAGMADLGFNNAEGWTGGSHLSRTPCCIHVYPNMYSRNSMDFRVRFKLLRILILASKVALGKVHLMASMCTSVKQTQHCGGEYEKGETQTLQS